jgi:hypothetical protein
VNSWRDQDVRRALSPLAAMAADTRVAVVLVAHLNKKEGSSAMYRGGGSIGIVAASRAAFLVAKDPEDEERRVLAPLKFNLGPRPQARTFRIEGAENGSSRVAWEGTSPLTVDQLLEKQTVNKLEEAMEFLLRELAGGFRLAAEVEARAAEAGISRRTLDRARKRLGVSVRREGFQGPVLIGMAGGTHELNATNSQEPDTKRELAPNDDPAPSPSSGEASSAPGGGEIQSSPLDANPRFLVGSSGDVDWQERAAIPKLDGGLPRQDTELAASQFLDDRASAPESRTAAGRESMTGDLRDDPALTEEGAWIGPA